MKTKYLLAYMDMLERFAETSEATRLKVASCLIKNGNPICYGINGTLKGWETNICEGEDGLTLPNVVLHSEINCLNRLRKMNETSVGATMMITHAPCLRCSHELVEAEIVKVYYRHDFKCSDGIKYLKENGVVVYKLE